MSELMEKLVREVVALRERVNALEVLEQAAGISDHGDLTGLEDDDHPQYQLAFGQGTAARRSANQPIPHEAWTPIVFDGVYWNDAGMYNSGLPSRLTIPSTGLYLVTALVVWQGDSRGLRGAAITKNSGAEFQSIDMRLPADANAVTIHGPSVICKLTAGDYIQVRAFQTSGVTINVIAYWVWSNLRAVRIA